MAGCGSVASILLLCVVLFAQAQDDIREPPRITKPSTSREQFAEKGENIVFECSAEGHPPPVYEWYLNGEILPREGSNGISYNSTTGILNILDLQISKEGLYNCRAMNTFPNNVTAVAVSPVIDLAVARIETWNRGKQKEFKVKEGSYLEITCGDTLPVYYGKTTFKWFLTDLNEGLLEMRPKNRMFTDLDGTLHFAYVEQEDQESDWYYACAMSNALEGNIRLGRKNKLIVTRDRDLGRKPPVLQYSTHYAKYLQGEDARLECMFSGYDPLQPDKMPVITWEDNAGDEIQADSKYSIVQNGRVLVIRNVQQSDEKEYTCIGADTQTSVKDLLFLNVTSAPVWERALQSQTVIQGEDAVFECRANSAFNENPPRPPIWHFNGVRLTEASKRENMAFLHQMTTLVVKNVSKDRDIACFQCSVGNSEGQVSSDGCLNVILPIDILVEPPSDQEIERGDIVNLTVLATSDRLYRLTYEWLFKNKTYGDPNAPPNVTYDPVSKEAYINTTNLSDKDMLNIEGRYRRVIFHQIQSRFVDVVVTLKDKPVVAVIPVAEAGFDYWIIGLIIGILIIIIVILIICCVICRRKMLEGDYAVDRKETAAGLDPEKELQDSGFSDLSRADYDLLPEKKQPSLDFDDIPMGDDESFGSADYGDEATAFNEDGSFIGQYSKRKKPEGPPAYEATESNV